MAADCENYTALPEANSNYDVYHQHQQNVLFGFWLILSGSKNSGILYPVTQTIDTYVYNALMNQNNPGMSAAAGFLQAIIGFILVVAANLLIRKISKEDAIF